jgi:hypothetical protein
MVAGHVVGVLGHEHQVERRPIVDHDVTLAVEDGAARGRTRFKRMRLCSESERYSSPALTCRCQRRTNVSPKSAMIRRARTRGDGGTRSESRAGC